jgi:uncharacterized protein
MKAVLLILAVLVLIWLLRGSVRRRFRSPPAATPPPAEAAAGEAQPIVACQQCGLHLPRVDALPGRGGVFCGEAHRADYERQHPSG